MKSKIARALLLLLVVTGIAIALHYRDSVDADALHAWVNNAGAAGPLLFMLIYTIGAVFFLPGSAITLVGGALFGPIWGTLYNLTGATLGAILAFLIARYFGSEWMEKKTGGRLKQLKEGVEGEGWRFVAFVRLVPLLPFTLLNYALGLTRIKLSHYIIATYLAMLPGAIAYTYLGYAGREAMAGSGGMIQKMLLALTLLAFIAFLPRVIGRMRQKSMLSVSEVKKRLDAKTKMLVLDVRSAHEFVGEQGHISGAKNISLDALPSRVMELADYEEHPIVVVCRTDRRSSSAAKFLAQQGFADVHVAKGGMTDWLGKGYHVER